MLTLAWPGARLYSRQISPTATKNAHAPPIAAVALLALLGCGSSAPRTGWISAERGRADSGQIVSYEQFRQRYRPHDKRPTGDQKAIKYMIALHQRGALTPLFMKHLIADFLAEGQRGIDKWQVIIVGVPRPLAGQMMDKTPVEHRARLLDSLPDDYALDILYYVARPTYDAIAGDVDALAR